MDAYALLWTFFIAGLLGVVIETIYCSVWVHRGALELRFALLYLPVNPLYGCAAVVLALALTPLASWPILVAIAGLAICTTFEYVAAAGLERLFGLVLWDYHDKPFNLRGRICLEAAVVWGALSLVLIEVVLPASRTALSSVPRTVGGTVLALMLLATAAAGALTVASFRRIARRVVAWERAAEVGGAVDLESVGDRFVHRLAPDHVVERCFACSRLAARYRELAAQASSAEHLPSA